MSSYWERRQAQNMVDLMADAEKTAKRLARIYKSVQRYLDDEAKKIFDRYIDAHEGMTEKEARKLFQKVQHCPGIFELMNYINRQAPGEHKKKLIDWMRTAAMQSRLKRLSKLENDVYNLIGKIHGVELKADENVLKSIADDAYLKTMFETQQRAGFGFPASTIPDNVLKTMLKQNWSGKHFSKRIWDNTEELAERVNEELIVSFLTGRTLKKTHDIIDQEFNKGVQNSRRLIRTESNYMANQAQLKAYKDAGITDYIFIATLDLKTSKICRGLDGKSFPVSEAMPEENYPPMHPWCRSTTMAYLPEEILKKMKREARDPVTGKPMKVPASMTYSEWYDRFVKDNPAATAKEKAEQNRNLDKEQYGRYQDVLDGQAPETFEEFQDLKYNDKAQWNRLKLAYKNAKLLKSIREEYNLKIHEGRQGKHIRGHNNYEGKSYLLDGIDPQELVNRYAGTGEIRRLDSGKWIKKQFFTHDDDIGVNINPVTGEEIRTNYFSISYSKEDGTHVVPRLKK